MPLQPITSLQPVFVHFGAGFKGPAHNNEQSGRLGRHQVYVIPAQFAHLLNGTQGDRTRGVPQRFDLRQLNDWQGHVERLLRDLKAGSAPVPMRVRHPLGQRARPAQRGPQRVRPQHWRVGAPDAPVAGSPVAAPRAPSKPVAQDGAIARKFHALHMTMPSTPLPFTDANRLGEPRKVGAGAFNSVYAVTYRGPDGQPLDTVFKPLKAQERGWVAHRTGIRKDRPNTANRNLATVEVAKKLGCSSVVPKTSVGTTTLPPPADQTPEVGLVMERAVGKPAAQTSVKTFMDGVVREKVTWLQLLDHLTGQGDRHANNYFIGKDPSGRVKVTGIDNDQCFGKNLVDPNDIRYANTGARHGFRGTSMPPVLDREMAASIKRMSHQDLQSVLGDKLTTEEVEATKMRLHGMKEHVRILERKGQIIDPRDWGTSKVGKMLTRDNSYVGRDSEHAAQARQPKPPLQQRGDVDLALRQFQRLLARNHPAKAA